MSKTGKSTGFIAGFTSSFRKNRQISAVARHQTRLKVQTKVYYSAARPLIVIAFAFLLGLFSGLNFHPVKPAEALIDTAATPETNISYAKKDMVAKTDTGTLSGPAATSVKSSAATNSTSGATSVKANLMIPSIGLYSSVVSTYVDANNDIWVPPATVGALTSYHGRTFVNKTFLVGHSATVFSGLYKVSLGDEIVYFGQTYTIKSKVYQVKSAVDMVSVIADESVDTLVLMTCAGEGNSERLIVTATLK